MHTDIAPAAEDARVLVGTASWTDPTLIACGRFYPRREMSAEERLRFYAGVFPLVEVDSSWYRLPCARNARLWAERTPEGFTMNLKAFGLFTGHRIAAEALDADIRVALGDRLGERCTHADLPHEVVDELWLRFREAIAPLADARRLGLVHLQFASGLRPDARGIAHVEHCVERLAGFTPSVEFRHRSWFDGAQRERTLELLRKLGAVHTVVDAPQGPDNTVPAVWAVTHPRYALLRLHGRNASTWNLRGAAASSSRFDYSYTSAELAELAAAIRRLQRHRETHVVFNTNMEDKGQRSALGLREALLAA
ncbi:MAG: DUF72 domain-containing protein [Aquabacterium sp.]|nr:MAG: DUF72 domain-containing protein [Aquabacterium sp.]